MINELKPGMVYSEDVFIDEASIFVPAGLKIKQRDIDSLARWGISHVLTDGSPLQDKESVKKSSDPSSILKIPAVNENKDLYRLYTDMVDRLNSFFNDIKHGTAPDLKNIELITQSSLKAVRDNESDLIGFILGGDIQGHALAKSSVNAAILSVVIGTHLKMPAHKLLQLATGALLHDVGMLKVPDDILSKKGNLSEDEVQKMKAHPLFSYRIIAKELGYPEEIGNIALQHHERFDGEGYPRKTPGVQIELGARIVSVADAFEAMVSEKPYRNSMIGYAAMKNLLSDNSRRFDPEVLRAFIKSMGIYPIGSIVLLNNSAIARVVEGHSDAPLRPKLKVLIDEYGRQFLNDEGDNLDLLTERTLFIAKPIDPKEFENA